MSFSLFLDTLLPQYIELAGSITETSSFGCSEILFTWSSNLPSIGYI
jgi:hypothetical protein